MSPRIAATCEAVEVPPNARVPVAISNNTDPNAKMSVRASTGAPSNCSGAMYGTVPMKTPATVDEAVTVAAVPCGCGATLPTPCFAIPKSSSLTPFRVNITLEGLRSR